jgi:nitroreductase
MTRNFDDGLRESMRAPRFGEPLPIVSSPETLAFLARRRSASAMTLGLPAPDDEQISALLAIAARVPDHGKLAPWRFVVLRGEAKSTLVAALETIAADRPDETRLIAKLGKLRTPPLCLVVVSRPVESEIPEWEQQLSAGAACMLLTLAAQAMGFGANWITDWYAYDEDALALLGVGAGEQVAGFVHLGTPGEAPLERIRPDVATITSVWSSPG